MPLQTASALTHTAGKGNVIDFPVTELARLIEEMRLALEFEPERAPNIALDFVKRIASAGAVKPLDARGGLAPWQTRKVERYLRGNLERSIRMSEVARAAKLSVSHFCRAFKKSFGETPHAYVLKLRLELAQSLMLTTDDPLSQIALSCGLADQAHLSKLFRRVFHDTPNAWRRRNLSEAQAEARGTGPVHKTRRAPRRVNMCSPVDRCYYSETQRKEDFVALFDNIELNLDAIAAKVGLPPHDVREIANTFQANLTSSDGNPEVAFQATAAQHDVSIETIQEILNLGGGLEGELGDFAGTLFKPGE